MPDTVTASLVRPPQRRSGGLDELPIAGVIQSASFFDWANRLMLSLGEPAQS